MIWHEVRSYNTSTVDQLYFSEFEVASLKLVDLAGSERQQATVFGVGGHLGAGKLSSYGGTPIDGNPYIDLDILIWCNLMVLYEKATQILGREFKQGWDIPKVFPQCVYRTTIPLPACRRSTEQPGAICWHQGQIRNDESMGAGGR